MDEEFLKRKIQALLHDPPEKAIILMQTGENHEERAKELLRELIQDDNIEEVKDADRNASSADRINLSYFEQKFLDNPMVRHPLSGDLITLDKIKTLDKTKVQETIQKAKSAVSKAIEEIKDECKDDYLEIYLNVWRKLLDLIKKHSVEELKPLWSVLPADTRIPDHSIWNHRNATAAFAGGIEILPSALGVGKDILYNLSFLLFSFGPVQEFISTARKTQDLWTGSYILSYLSWQAMKVVAESFGPDAIVFPDLYRQPLFDKWLITERNLKLEKPDINLISTPTLPNRFLAILPQKKEGKYQPSELAQKAKDVVNKTWKKIAKSVKEELEKKLSLSPNPVWNHIWERQIEDFIESYWIGYDWKASYNDALSEYQSLIETDEAWEFGELIGLYEDKTKSQYLPNLGTVYQLFYELTERSLGIRKSLRDFKQSEEPNYKCTLCGVRDPLHDKNDPGYEDLRKFWTQFNEKNLYEIRPGGRERLCAVCVTKRFAIRFYFKSHVFDNRDLDFPSVGTIATANYQNAVVQNIEKLRDIVRDFNEKAGGFIKSIGAYSPSDTLPKINGSINQVGNKELQKILKDFVKIDGEWLYEESINEDRLEKEYGYKRSDPNHRERFKEAQKAVSDLIKKTYEIAKTKPSKYYAVLYMDGDNMGKWLSGDLAPKIFETVHPGILNELKKKWGDSVDYKRPLSPALHSSISSALRNFSLILVRHIVEERYLGKLVYAGGDDVLAFVPLSDLFNFMRDLRAFYSGFVDEKNGADFKKGDGFIDFNGELLLTMGRKATASMGVVTAHHLQPLSQVMKKVREMEEFAKEIDKEKNAFAISVLKRSGEREEARVHWFYDDSGFDLVELLIKLGNAFADENIQPKFIYDLKREMKGLSGTLLPFRAREKEISRLMKRHKSDQFDDSEFKKIEEGVLNLHTYVGGFEEFLKILSIANFVAREK